MDHDSDKDNCGLLLMRGQRREMQIGDKPIKKGNEVVFLFYLRMLNPKRETFIVKESPHLIRRNNSQAVFFLSA